MELYSLRKSKKILLHVYHLWRKKRKKLSSPESSDIQKELKELQTAILEKNRQGVSIHAQKCGGYGTSLLKKTPFQAFRDFVIAVIVALVIAFLIRQVWFELYEIPTGSMRPTFKEKDRLIVSKTTFGVNIPFTKKHLYFDPNLVKRGGIIVFTVEDMDVQDPDTLYFWIFPGKKQFVKRLMGKPGDTLYFYGGKIYGIDSAGNEISSELAPPELERIHHVPFIRFQGNVTPIEPFQIGGGYGFRTSILHQMNEPVARLSLNGANRLEGEMLFTPNIHNRSAPPVKNFYELWGIGNYGQVRIVTKEEVRVFEGKHSLSLGEGEFFLELKHHPNIHKLEMGRDFLGRMRPQFLLETSILKLDEAHLKKLFNNLYTGRFVVKNGYALRYSAGGLPKMAPHMLVRLEGVPDGTYEYYDGQPYQIKWLGVTKKLGKTHPLSQYTSDLVYKLFNFGIDFDKRHVMGSQFETERFAYFRDGDLYVMGTLLYKKQDPFLQEFQERERALGSEGKAKDSYIPFLDTGSPLTLEGKIDREKIKHYGLLIPPQSYLALGDNFAMSSDSRDFGFVPQGNLRGTPSFIFWPPGSRFGPPNQPPYSWITFPNLLILTLAVIGFLLWYSYHRRHHRIPLKDL